MEAAAPHALRTAQSLPSAVCEGADRGSCLLQLYAEQHCPLAGAVTAAPGGSGLFAGLHVPDILLDGMLGVSCSCCALHSGGQRLSWEKYLSPDILKGFV